MSHFQKLVVHAPSEQAWSHYEATLREGLEQKYQGTRATVTDALVEECMQFLSLCRGKGSHPMVKAMTKAFDLAVETGEISADSVNLNPFFGVLSVVDSKGLDVPPRKLWGRLESDRFPLQMGVSEPKPRFDFRKGDVVEYFRVEEVVGDFMLVRSLQARVIAFHHPTVFLQVPGVGPVTCERDEAMSELRFVRSAEDALSKVLKIQPSDLRPPFLPTSGPRQLEVPAASWGMTFQQFKQFVNWCKETPEYKQIMDFAATVNWYNLEKIFITPMTKDAECSVALLMNKDAPRAAQVMISHVWGEDVDECTEALDLALGEAGLGPETVIWFCPLAIYQAGGGKGGKGPDIQSQLDLEPAPFAQVIISVQTANPGMLAVHTTVADIYERAWCVFEVDEADTSKVVTKGAPSSPYVCMVMGTGFNANSKPSVNTEEARCGNPSDEEMIKKLITAKEGGFERLNEVVTRFRDDMESAFGDIASLRSTKGTMLGLGVLRRIGADFNNCVTLQSSPFPSDGTASEVAGAVEELLVRGAFTYSELLLQNIVGWVDLAIKGHPSAAKDSPIGWSVVSSDGKAISDSKPELVKVQYSEKVWYEATHADADPEYKSHAEHFQEKVVRMRMGGSHGYEFDATRQNATSSVGGGEASGEDSDCS